MKWAKSINNHKRIIPFLKDCLAEKNKKIERFSQEVAAMGKELTKMKTEVLRVKITGSQIYGEDSLNASK